MPEIMIFKSGKYPQGDWSKERVQRMVDAYDPVKSIEASMVIGHRDFRSGRLPVDNDEAQFAHGWVKSLRMDGAGKVFAVVEDVSDKAKSAVAKKRLKYISAEIFEFDEIDPKDPPYLRAIALLGRDTPAIPTTALPTFFNMLTGGGTISVIDESQHLIAFTRKINAAELQEVGNPTYEVSPAGSTGGETKQANHTNKESTMNETDKLKKELEEKEAKLAAFRKENEILKASESKRDAETFFSNLRDEGILPPAMFEQAVAIDQKLDAKTREGYRELLSAFEKKVDLSGEHTASKKKAGADTTPQTGEELSAKIRAFQRERKLETFGEAAEILYAEKPELFEGGK